MKDEIKYNYKIFRATKYILVVIAFISLLIVSYLVFINQNNKISQKDANETSNQQSKSLSKFEVGAPNLSGLSLEHGPYYVKAVEMMESAGKISFIKPRIKLMVKHFDWVSLSSERANLVREDNHFTLYEKIKGNFNQQYYLESEQLEILTKESIINLIRILIFILKIMILNLKKDL